MAMRIGIVVGEMSGDALAAGLVAALRKKVPDLIVEGIAGPQLQAQGCQTLFPMEKLAVMGISEVLKHLPEILRIRRKVMQHFIKNPPDVFIGVDAPDFNLKVELVLRWHGIPTVHYVSPSVWAWKPSRIYKIKRAVDLMLTLFPFESYIYEKTQIPYCYVGHPRAQSLPMFPDKSAARAHLGLVLDVPVIALLPGSRASEVAQHTELFLQAARICLHHKPGLQVVLPAANTARHAQIIALMQNFRDVPVTLLEGHAIDAMVAADVVVSASGTATLEAMLCKRPMVVAHRLSAFTWWLANRLVRVKYCALPNLLANESCVPEYLQDKATPEAIAAAVLDYLNHPEKIKSLVNQFKRMHETLRQNSDEIAADAVLQLIRSARF